MMVKQSKTKNGFVKFVLEFGPLIAFWISNSYGKHLLFYYPILSRFGGVFLIATTVLMLATVISLVFSWFLLREIQAFSLISGIFVLVFGVLAVWFHNETFIKMKPTILYVLCFSILFVGNLFGKNFLGLFFSCIIRLDSVGWQKLTMRWAFFFLFLACLNEGIWRNFSTETWVLFKVIGVFPIAVFFGIAQVNLIKKHAIHSE